MNLVERSIGPALRARCGTVAVNIVGRRHCCRCAYQLEAPLLGTSFWMFFGYAAPFRLASLTFALVLVLMLQVGQSRRAVMQQSALLFAGFSLALWVISPSPELDQLALVAAGVALMGALLARKQ